MQPGIGITIGILLLFIIIIINVYLKKHILRHEVYK